MSKELANNQPSPVRLIIYSIIFLIIAVIVGMVFARMIAISQSNATNNNKSAEFIPVKIDNGQRELKGKILPNFDTTIQATHKLLDKDLKLIAYLTANNDILKVSEGFSVTVIGKVEGKSKDNVEIIRVEKIKLK